MVGARRFGYPQIYHESGKYSRRSSSNRVDHVADRHLHTNGKCNKELAEYYRLRSIARLGIARSRYHRCDTGSDDATSSIAVSAWREDEGHTAGNRGRIHMKGIAVAGVVIALLGLVGLAIPVFSTSQTKDVAKIGGLKIQANEETSHVVPPMLAGGALVIGLVMAGAGFLKS